MCPVFVDKCTVDVTLVRSHSKKLPEITGYKRFVDKATSFDFIENEINPDTMTEYLDFFRYGAPTHGGFGLGITRTLVKLFDLPSVKDVTFLFRGPSRLKP